MYQPLADEIRPQDLDQVVGQAHILGPNGMLRRIIESGKIPNMVFYGPSGTGKTTVANIIAQRTSRALRRLNATTAALSDVRDIMNEVGTLLAPNGVLLYLDEIQYFNKKQQQSLLEFIENGKITLIASAGARSLSSSRWRQRTFCPPWTGPWRCSRNGWAWRSPVRTGCGSTLRPPAGEMCAKR